MRSVFFLIFYQNNVSNHDKTTFKTWKKKCVQFPWVGVKNKQNKKNLIFYWKKLMQVFNNVFRMKTGKRSARRYSNSAIKPLAPWSRLNKQRYHWGCFYKARLWLARLALRTQRPWHMNSCPRYAIILFVLWDKYEISQIFWKFLKKSLKILITPIFCVSVS